MEQARRRYPRIAAEHTVMVRLLGPEGLEGFTKTGTVGPGGCMIFSDEPLGVDAIVEIMITFQGRGVRAVGRVAYEKPRPGGGLEIGIEFIDTTDEDRATIESLFE
jgi:hypothetical protein